MSTKSIMLLLMFLVVTTLAEASEFVITKRASANPSLPSSVSKLVITSRGPVKVTKRKVRYWGAVWCGPCQPAKKGLKELSKELEFELEEFNADEKSLPTYAPQTIPYIEWDSLKDSRQILFQNGWEGKQKFKEKFLRDTPAKSE